MKPGSFVVFINYPTSNEKGGVKSYKFIPFTPILKETILTVKKITNNLVSFVEVNIVDQDNDLCHVHIKLLKEIELPKLPNFIENIEFENV